jgi:hypothetical protein
VITLKTINTIELSNECNLACSYCISKNMRTEGIRDIGIMSDEVFEKSLELLRETVSRGTQMEVNLNGNGESLLDPDIIPRVRRVKDIMGGKRVRFCTNGLLLTYEIAKKLRYAGIDDLDISVHSAKHARKANMARLMAGIPGVVATGAIEYPHNWAGQLEPENSVPDVLMGIPCDPLKHGYGYIQKEGNISPCCFDYRNLGTFGTVFDADIFDKQINPYALCDKCHQIIPEEILQENAA